MWQGLPIKEVSHVLVYYIATINLYNSLIASVPSDGPGDISAIVTCIKEEINRKFAPLKNLFEPSINRVTAELFTVGIISDEVQRNPSTNSILQDFYTGFAFMNTIEKVEQHCKKFFSIFDKMGGPFTIAGNSLKQDIAESISRNFDFNISFDS